MDDDTLNNLDRRILHLLQVDARGKRDTDIADRTDVTSTTIANRIEALEERGVIKGYYPEIDYETAGYPLVVLFICTAPVAERERLAEQVREVHGVVNVRELLAGEENLHVQAVAESTSRIEEITQDIDELGLAVRHNVIVSKETTQPWNHFQEKVASDISDGAAETTEE
jgi:DNA-binding Lrp family transcriptional regulator